MMLVVPRWSSFSLFALTICNPAVQCAVNAFSKNAPNVIQNRGSLHRRGPLYMSSTSSSLPESSTFLDAVSAAASEALGRNVELVATSGGGFAGGGGASTSALLDKVTDTKYFLKSARGGLDMLRGEYEGVKAMSETGSIQVPTPIAFGEYETTGQAFVLFDYLIFCGGGSQYELGVMLAKVSACVSCSIVL
jgi:hypothetical protein